MDIKDKKFREKLGVITLVLILVVTGILLIKDDPKPIVFKDSKNPESTKAVSAPVTATSFQKTSQTTPKIAGKVNINTASLEDLDTLPGVGEKTAQKIIDYRTTKSKFNSTEDIKNVSGIGDAKFNAMKDLISI